MELLADTVAIIRHFAKFGNIGVKAKEVLQNADNGEASIFISIISIVEVMYLFEVNKIPIGLADIQQCLEGFDNYKIVDLDFDIVTIAEKIKGMELHDRLIVATARYLNVPILTSDEEIKNSVIVKVIWN